MMYSLRVDARYWLKRDLDPSLARMIDDFRDDQLERLIEQRYEGGWDRFVSIHSGRTPVDDSDLDPQIALRRELRQLLGRHFVIAACHEIIRVDTMGDRINLVIRVIEEDERGSRIIQHGAKIRLIVFDALTSLMLPEEGLELDDLDWVGETVVNSHLKVMDPERYSAKFWQWYECYRPGTDKAPLQGRMARVNLYDEYEAFKRTMEGTS